MHHAFHFWTWLGHFFGVSDESGPGYGFFSGVGSDIGELTIVAAIIVAGRNANCHVGGCWRIGRHVVHGTPYKTCRRHHPTIPDKKPTAGEINAAHWAAKRKESE